MSHLIWRDFDGLGKNTRVGLNFTEKGYGIRPALGCSDRGPFGRLADQTR
jgi:2-dehydro-3-deoxygluconokinase